MKQFLFVTVRSKELWLVEENHATVKPDSSFALRRMKTYSESRIQRRNLQIFKKMPEKSSQFLSSEQPYEPKSLDVALKIAGAEKYPRKTSGCHQPRAGPFDSSFEWKELKSSVEIFVFCGWWFSNQFDIVSETHFSLRCSRLWAVVSYI